MTHVDPDNEATFHVHTIKSGRGAIDSLKQVILDAVKKEHYGDEAIFGIKLALEEALCNADKHGNECCPDKTITVRYAVNAEKMVVIVRDEGAGFDPDCIPDPTTPDRLPVPTGRGIMLIRAYMDVVEFRDRGREIFFMKRRNPAS